jgi:dihydropteroate synthase/2-amino-4-hydroxy-6-hydroxymethyldihydropteridine diphosphokinase
MKCFIGLGSSLGDRRANLERAVAELATLSTSSAMRVSPVYETPALVQADAPEEWRVPYLNAVAEIEWTGSAKELLTQLKHAEVRLGRTPAPRWAPRIIDLDLLTFGDEIIETKETETLVVPHRGILGRSFVLDPLKDLRPDFRIPGTSAPVVVQARRLSTHAPLIMGIVNLTPDSFSDGGRFEQLANLETQIQEMIELGVPLIDLGAESTRPGAVEVPTDEEWRRLEPALRLTRDLLKGRRLRPLVSLDTRKPEIVERALAYGIDWVNDVSGFSNSKMREVVRDTPCELVVMHSLTVPADPKVIWPANTDPIAELKIWLTRKLEDFETNGISSRRVIFDPGLGFGKGARHSIAIIKRLEELKTSPVRLLIGHSRKSFMKGWDLANLEARDTATLAVSLELAKRGADVIRVHDYARHLNAFRAQAEIHP